MADMHGMPQHEPQMTQHGAQHDVQQLNSHRSTARQLWPSEQPAPPSAASRDLVVMLLDAEESYGGAFHLFGRTCDQRSVLVRVTDFAPYFFLPSPAPPPGWSPAGAAGQQHMWDLGQLAQLQQLLNNRLPADCRVVALTESVMRPIMYYRTGSPGGSPFLRLELALGQASARKAAGAVTALCKEGGPLEAHGFRFPSRLEYEAEVKPLTRFLCDASLSGGAWLYVPTANGLVQGGGAGYTHVSPGARVSCCDVEVTAPWRSLQSLTPDATQLADPTWQPQVVQQRQQQRQNGSLGNNGVLDHALKVAMAGAILPLRLLTVDVALAPHDGAKRVALPSQDPVIAIACEVHTVRFGGPDGSEEVAGGQPGAQHQRGGNHRNGRKEHGAGTAEEPVELLGSDEDKIEDEDDDAGDSGQGVRLLVPGGQRARPGVARADGGRSASERVVFVLAGPAHGGSGTCTQGGGGLQAGSTLHVPVGDAAGDARVVVCGSERELLGAWREWVMHSDPDALVTFQLRDTLGALAARAQAIQLPLDGPGLARPGSGAPGQGLYLSRLLPEHSGPCCMASVVMYTPAWVKSQSRMASTSNQETFKMQGLGGRLVCDVLRQVLTHQSLATFTLADCTQTLLKETLEVLAPGHLAQLWREMQGADCMLGTPTPTPAPGPGSPRTPTPTTRRARAGSKAGGSVHKALPSSGPPTKKSKHSTAKHETPPSHAENGSGSAGQAADKGVGTAAGIDPLATSAVAAAVRLARYCLRRTSAVRSLTSVLATVPEAFEMARVTGLSINEVQNKAQMVRTWSLLLRSARRAGYLVGGRQEAVQLVESPLLMHPLEHQTAGLYRQPVACLDFASLYPSLYRAHNLCYTTLVVSEDIPIVGQDNLFVTPAGHAFLKPNVRQGILPGILAALMSARTRTRELLKATPASAPATRAVLDARQKALKVTANALYGFTGAQASMLQCAPLADSCLALGAASCRMAIQTVGDLHAEGAFGEPGRGARVIYGQTDSLFVLFPQATPAQAVVLGKQAARLVTERCFQTPMTLQFERVYAPFLLLHVNRYAGKAYETEEQAASGQAVGLLVKGVRSMWRQSAPFVQGVLQTAMDRIIMRDDVQGAVAHAEEEIHRLLSGRVELWELVMTGGLWRLTGQQVAAAAAALDATASPPSGSGHPSAAHGAGGGAPEEVRGPHAALAVKLAQRDPGRTFLLGERIQYVLLAGARLQDDAAEDPLLAAELGLPPHLELYWRNKLMTPLQEIFEKVLSPSQLQSLLSGPHTLVRVEQLSHAAATGNPEVAAAAAVVAGAGATPGIATIDSYASSKAKGGKQQPGMTSFFKQTAKCLACRQSVAAPSTAPAPALCPSCAHIEGRWAEVMVGAERDTSAQQALLTATTATCMRCHSGGVMGKISCANSECNVLYDRLGAARRLGMATARLARLDVGGGTMHGVEW